MTLGTKDILSLSVEHYSNKILPLNMLFRVVSILWSEWRSLSMIDISLLWVHYSTTDDKASSKPDHRAGLPHQFVQSSSVSLLSTASPAHHSKKEDTGNDRLLQ